MPVLYFYFLPNPPPHFTPATHNSNSHIFYAENRFTGVSLRIILWVLWEPYHGVQFFISATQQPFFCLMRKDNQENKLAVSWLTLFFCYSRKPKMKQNNQILPRKTFPTISITILIGLVWLPDYPLISTGMLFGKSWNMPCVEATFISSAHSSWTKSLSILESY